MRTVPPHPSSAPPLPPAPPRSYVATDMSSHRGSLTPSQGADTPAWLAGLPQAEAEALSGKFIRERRVEPF